MIYFDNNTFKILKYIKRNKCVSEQNLIDNFGDISFLLIDLSKEGYTIAQNENGNWYSFDTIPYHTNPQFKYYVTPKGNELIEQRKFNFWKWSIPTFISILSLVISIATLLLSVFGNDIIKVMLVK